MTEMGGHSILANVGPPALVQPELATISLGVAGIAETIIIAVYSQRSASQQWRNQFFLQEKVRAYGDLFVTLQESHRDVHQRVLFGEGQTPAAEVDTKIEATIDKYHRASAVLSEDDRETVEGAWLKEKSFISHPRWAGSVRISRLALATAPEPSRWKRSTA